jgi:F420-non-reducing hydrogenase small subunit
MYEPGEVIFAQGDPGDEMYLIQSGAVEYAYRQGDRETVLTVLERGDFFGEMALFGQERRPATTRAVRQTRLLPLTRASLLETVREDPGVALHLLEGLYLRIQHADHQIQQAVENDEILRQALARREERAPAPAQVEQASDAELASLWDVAQETLWFEPGQTIYRQGDAGAAMYVILDGSVELVSGSGSARYVLLTLSAGNFFGESELITGLPRTSFAIAIARTRLLTIPRDEFLERVRERPELALFVLQGLSASLQNIGLALENPKAAADAVRQNWRPLLNVQARVKVAMVALSTCAGCSAVFLEPEVLATVLEAAEIVYCPMLMDQEHMPEADVALVEGAVRLKEDQEKLEEVRAKSGLLVAWGTCASFAGLPAHANRYELEDLIQETYGHTADAYAYYLSGRRGVERATYQEEGVGLMRKAYEVDDFCRVDYYVPGCPPRPDLLLQLLAELTGQSLKGAKPVVCAECGRRPTKGAVASLEATARQDDGKTCFHSQGVLCLGVLTKGGCAAVCTRSGLPCWGCRGPAKSALKAMSGGDSFEEAVIDRLARRCRMEGSEVRPAVKRLRTEGHALFEFERNFLSSLSRIR